MSQDCLSNKRLTVQQFILPFSKAHSSSSFSLHKKQKPSLTNYQSQKKIICGSQPTITQFRERQSQQLKRLDSIPSKPGSLPEIRGKSRTLDTSRVCPEEPLHCFSSRKLNVNVYRKIEKSISSKYSRKMESLASLNFLPHKIFTINNLKGDLPPPKLPERERQERPQRSIGMEKHHIDRLKDQYQIPLELQTQRYHQQEFDNHQLNLQLKNIIRFEFHTQMNFSKPKKVEKQEHTRIEGWDNDHSTLRPPHLYS